MDDDVITQLQLVVGNSGDVKKPELASNHKLHKWSIGIKLNFALNPSAVKSLFVTKLTNILLEFDAMDALASA